MCGRRGNLATQHSPSAKRASAQSRHVPRPEPQAVVERPKSRRERLDDGDPEGGAPRLQDEAPSVEIWQRSPENAASAPGELIGAVSVGSSGATSVIRKTPARQ